MSLEASDFRCFFSTRSRSVGTATERAAFQATLAHSSAGSMQLLFFKLRNDKGSGFRVLGFWVLRPSQGTAC